MHNRWDQKLHVNQHNLGLCYMAEKMVHGVPLSMSRIPPRTKTSTLYLVEDIIAERMAKKHKEWLVRWKGFCHEDDTWEPLEHLGGWEQYIARFEEECDHQPSLRCSLSSAYCFLVPSIIAICKTRVTTPLATPL